MKISICITTFNEEGSIKLLLNSLGEQTKKPDEAVFVDARSTDSTVDIIRSYAKRFKRFKLVVRKCSRAEGRNIAVRSARYSIIAMTDAGCILDKDWVEKVTHPFKDKSVDVVAGFYKMKARSSFQKALSIFLGKTDFDDNFLPSTRSIAFTKRIWRRVGGFDQSLDETAEDTVFNYKAIKEGAKIVGVGDAIVYWSIPRDVKTGIKKIYSYAKGDAKSKIFWHPLKRFESHNIKVLLVFLRYFTGVVFVFLGFYNHLFLALVGFFLVFYIFRSFYKTYTVFRDFRVGAWGIILQFLADLSVMAGFARGIIG